MCAIHLDAKVKFLISKCFIKQNKNKIERKIKVLKVSFRLFDRSCKNKTFSTPILHYFYRVLCLIMLTITLQLWVSPCEGNQ